MTDKTRQIIELRKQGKNYDEIVIILGVTMKSVRYVCQTYHYAYQDIEEAWRQNVADLRKSGKTYSECAEILGVSHDKVERYCLGNSLRYSDLGQKAPVVCGWHGKRYYGPNPHKGKPFIDWQQKLDEKTNYQYEVTSIEFKKSGESTLTIKCRKCGGMRTVSSISVRHSGNIVCGSCFEIERSRKERERKIDQAIIAWQKEVKRSRSLKQQELPLCECGQLLPEGKHKCDKCRELNRKMRQQRKDHMRRIREGVQADKDISLEKLYERDNGVCYLCGKTCDWSDFQKVNGAFIVGGSYPTVEHLFPLCKGGSHTWDNIKLACHSCNSKKGYK